MLFQWDIEKIIKETLNKHDLKINFKYDPHLLTPMSYNIITNTIKYNHMQINGYKSKCKINMDDSSFCEIILYHEIGHYIDFKNDYKGEFSISERERNAWNNGRTLIPDHLLDIYDKVRKLDRR